MGSLLPISSTVADIIIPGPDGDALASGSFHDRLVAAGFVPRPICVIGTVDDGTRYAEVFEEESRAWGRPACFLVRLVVPGECEHIFTLADLPELLQHFDRLTSLFAHVAEGRASGAGSRPQAPAPPGARRRSRI